MKTPGIREYNKTTLAELKVFTGVKKSANGELCAGLMGKNIVLVFSLISMMLQLLFAITEIKTIKIFQEMGDSCIALTK